MTGGCFSKGRTDRFFRAGDRTVSALEAVPVDNLSRSPVRGDGQLQGTSFFANRAAGAGGVDVQPVAMTADELLQGPDRTESAPGAGSIDQRQHDADDGRDDAHLPEDMTPVLPASGRLADPDRHEAEQGQAHPGTKFHGTKKFRKFPAAADTGKPGIEKTSTRTEITAKITSAKDTRDQRGNHHHRNHVSCQRIFPPQRQNRDDDQPEKPFIFIVHEIPPEEMGSLNIRFSIYSYF
jgi:hypothetical protein